MSDPRLSDYAKLLVEDCVDVQPGWQVVVMGSYLGRPLLEEVVPQVTRRGAYAFLHVTLARPRRRLAPGCSKRRSSSSRSLHLSSSTSSRR